MRSRPRLEPSSKRCERAGGRAEVAALASRSSQFAAEKANDRAAKMSVAQVERELAEAGFDVAAARAKAEGLLDWLDKGQPSPSN